VSVLKDGGYGLASLFIFTMLYILYEYDYNCMLFALFLVFDDYISVSGCKFVNVFNHNFYTVKSLKLDEIPCVFCSFFVLFSRFLPRCMECRRGLAMRILSVRLSVCPSHA